MTWTLLHDACEHLDAKLIYDRCNKGTNELLEVDDHGSTPLHILAWAGADPKLLQALVSSCPSAVTDKDIHGDTCLHVACSFPETNVKAIKVLLDACPTLASITNKEGLMPLHMACRFAPNNDSVIGYLIEAYPYALRSRIKMGSPPPPRKRRSHTQQLQPKELHFVLPHEGTNFSELRFQNTASQVRDGAYPLHIAIKAGAAEAVVEMLIKGAEDVLTKTNKYGETPLHVALAVEAKNELVELLIAQGVEALYMKDKTHKNLPIHVAATQGCSVRVAKALLEHRLASIHEENVDGKTALDLCLDSKKCGEAVMHLFESSNDAEVPLE